MVMRILIASDAWYPQINGVVRTLGTIVDELAELGHAVDVLGPDRFPTETASITLKRQAFESWRTGYSSAFAIILFVAVFGLANIYVKVLNKVKSR